MKLKGLNLKWLKTIVLSMALLGPNSTSFSQTSSTASDSVKCFSIKDAKTLLKYAERGYFCDSLTVQYEEKVKTYKTVVSVKDEELLLSQRLIEAQMMQINKQSKQIKFFKMAVISLGAVCLIELILIL